MAVPDAQPPPQSYCHGFTGRRNAGGRPVSGSIGSGFAIRAAFDAGTTNPVSTMPSGVKSRSWRNSPRRFFVTASTARPATSSPWLYSQTVPGW